MIYNYNKLTPFKKYIIQNFPYIDADFDALTNYELYAKVVEYLNKVIDSTNTQNEYIEQLTDAFNSLHDYVQDYFDNLDVQDEINNKIDEMVTTGQFQEIFSNIFSDLQNQITALASGSPAGVYATVSALESADPNHSRTYVVTADGKWYYYNTTSSEWTAGGTYQSTGLVLDELLNVSGEASDGEATGSRIKFLNAIEETTFDSSMFELGNLGNNGEDTTGNYRFRTKNILYTSNDINITVPFDYSIGFHIFDADGTHTSWSGWKEDVFTIAKGTYFRAIVKKTYYEDTSSTIDYVTLVAGMNVFTKRTNDQLRYNAIENNLIDDYSNFVNAGLYNGKLTTDIHRIASKNIFQYPCDVKIYVPQGYMIGYHSYNDSFVYQAFSGWTTENNYLSIAENTNVRLIVRKVVEVTGTALSISDTIPVFDIYVVRQNNHFDIGKTLKEYGSIRVEFSQAESPTFSINGWDLTVKMPGRLFLFNQSFGSPDAFTSYYLSTTEFTLTNNQLLVLNLTSGSVEVVSQATFTGDKEKYIVLLWNHYGNIKGLLADFYVRNAVNISNDESCFEVTSRQGEVDGYPENTLQGFKRAKQFGYNHIRVSIGWTSDDVPICAHSDQVAGSTLRNLDGTQVEDTSVVLSGLTYQYITEHFDAGIYKGDKFAGISVPTLESLLKQAKALNQKVDIEYKFGYTETRLEDLLEMVYQYGLQDVAIYSTTSSTQIGVVQNSDNKIKTAIITNLTQANVTSAIALNVDRIDMFDTDTYDADAVILAHQNGIKVKVGSAYNLTQANSFIEKYDVVECAGILNPIISINRS